MNPMRSTLFATLLALAMAPAAQAHEARTLRALLPGQPGEAAPGCALAVYRDGALSHLVSDGVADLARGNALDGDTVFYAASISKQFTALALAQLSLQGRVDLDGDVRQWIPELPVFAATVTPRMLLQHSSGILDSLSLVQFSKGPGAASRTSRDDTLALVLAQTHTNFTPGTATTYSNGAYLLAAELVERVSGERYPDYIRRHILAPLGMRDSYMLDGEPAASPHRAHGYVSRGDGFEVRDTYPRYGGSGGLMLSLNDLARYEYDIERGHKVWTREVRALMEAPGILADGTPAYREDRDDGVVFALGLMVGERAGRRIVEHGGGAEAFRHMYTRVPEANLAVAAFCNRPDSHASDKVDAAIGLLLGPKTAVATTLPSAGVYRARTLPVEYVLSRPDPQRATLAILPDGASHPAQVVEFRRDGDAGAFKSGAITLEIDGDGLVLGQPRANGIRADRVAR